MYRDGKDGTPKDVNEAKRLFQEYITRFALPGGKPFPELYGKAHHNLGMIAYRRQDYLTAQQHFSEAAAQGIELSKRNILQMRIHGQLPATLEECFLAICDYHGYTLPMPRSAFVFDQALGSIYFGGNANISGNFGVFLDAIHLKSASSIKAPVVWIRNEGGLTGDGRVEAQLLVVGQKKIDLKK
ncbi:MAG: hypothetical protein C0514_05975 [Candidatus Puniceispirillum sp.]|nr:hypothetical protein [Candidatus Puniceispirillum sp.]